MGETEVGAELRAELRAYIEEAFLYLHPDVELRDEDQFLELGVIDSLGFVELVEEVQTRYGIAVDALEITEENFGSLGALVAFVERRRGT
jgi:acyl carrier protein